MKKGKKRMKVESAHTKGFSGLSTEIYGMGEYGFGTGNNSQKEDIVARARDGGGCCCCCCCCCCSGTGSADIKKE